MIMNKKMLFGNYKIVQYFGRTDKRKTTVDKFSNIIYLFEIFHGIHIGSTIIFTTLKQCAK